MRAYRSLSSISFSLCPILALTLVACGGGSGGTGAGGSGASAGSGGGGAGGSGGSAECVAEGSGTLEVEVTGLPESVPADVTLTGPAGERAVDGSETISDAAAGGYEVTAARVTAPDPIVRAVFDPSVSSEVLCVEDGGTTTTTVDYAQIPTSHKLWITNGNSEAGAVLGFDGASLGATGAPAATAAVNAGAGKDVAFDRDGNLWTMAATLADAMLQRFPAASLGTSGAKEPDREINFVGNGCLPAVAGMAFDADGQLWVSSPCADAIVRLSVEDLAASGEVTPAVTISGIVSPSSLAFDADGNLWAVSLDAGAVVRYDAARLGASTSGAPDRTLSADNGGGGKHGPSWLAFDASGKLWANDFGANAVYAMAAADLAGSGEATVTPTVRITLGVNALLESMAFDESGGLWMAGGAGQIVRIAPAQLGVSTSPGDPTVPETVVSSADIGYANNLAFFPAPAALPLYHALP